MQGAVAERFTGQGGPRVIGPTDGKLVDLGGGLGARFMAWGDETGGTFSLVEHPMEPRTLAAPLHRHTREDEYSFVIEGRMGAQLGDDLVEAGPGDFVFKPRGQWHSFWNPGDERCRILEIISPAGFEGFFDELPATLAGIDAGVEAAGAALAQLGARYGLEFDFESIGPLCERHGLRMPQ